MTYTFKNFVVSVNTLHKEYFFLEEIISYFILFKPGIHKTEQPREGWEGKKEEVEKE